MLMHVPDADRASGSLYSISIGKRKLLTAPYIETTRLITRSFCDSFKNGWIGRRLSRLFKQHGHKDISVTPQTIRISYPFLELLLGGHVTRALRRYCYPPTMPNAGGPICARRTNAGTFFYAFTALIVTGTKG
jgi:hypothetical protein